MDDAIAAEVRQSAKVGEPDRYLAALLAPASARDDLIAIAALGSELRRIVATISEPTIGEIRIQFWRDALTGSGAHVSAGHPIADAAAAMLRRHPDAPALVGDLLDAYVHRLYGDGPADAAQFNLELKMTEGALFRLAALALGLDLSRAADAIDAAGASYGAARIGLDLPASLARGRNPMPPDWSAEGWTTAIARLADESRGALSTCRVRLRDADARLNTALLPVAVVEPYLSALQRLDRDPARDIAEIAPLTRAWRIARAHYGRAL